MVGGTVGRGGRGREGGGPRSTRQRLKRSTQQRLKRLRAGGTGRGQTGNGSSGRACGDAGVPFCAQSVRCGAGAGAPLWGDPQPLGFGPQPLAPPLEPFTLDPQSARRQRRREWLRWLQWIQWIQFRARGEGGSGSGGRDSGSKGGAAFYRGAALEPLASLSSATGSGAARLAAKMAPWAKMAPRAVGRGATRATSRGRAGPCNGSRG